MTTKWMTSKGVKAEKITGDVSQVKREELISRFQANGVSVVVLSTKAGGVSITLDNANTVIHVDETWDPDDQEQVEDRAHRISRLHQVNVFILRSKGTIEEYIQQRVLDKAAINREILDLRRQGLRATA